MLLLRKFGYIIVKLSIIIINCLFIVFTIMTNVLCDINTRIKKYDKAKVKDESEKKRS